MPIQDMRQQWNGILGGHAIALAAGFSVKKFDSNENLCYNKENLTNPWFLVS